MNRRQPPWSNRSLPRVEVLEAKQLLTTFAVSCTADAGPGSLRQAILDVDADTSGSTDVPQITFAIPGAGVQTIAPTTPLPSLTRATLVDATTQPGYVASPLVVLDGVDAVDPAGEPVPGLDFAVADGTLGTAVRGLEIVRFSGPGIASAAASAQISDVLIGTDSAGDPGLGNGGAGIQFGNFGGNTVADSVIANNGLRAIGGIDDRPGVPTTSGPDVAIDNVTTTGNDTQGTTLAVTTAAGGSTGVWQVSGSDPGTISYTVTNTGSNVAHNVGIDLSQDPNLDSLTILSATTSQGSIQADVGSQDQYPSLADLGTLAPGASATITVTYQFQDAADPQKFGYGALRALATSPDLDYAAASTQATYDLTDAFWTGSHINVITPQGHMDDESVQWGDLVTLTYTAVSDALGPADDVTLSITQPVDAGNLTVVSATVSQGTVSSDLSLDDGHPAFANFGTLGPNGSATLTLVVRVGPVDPADPDDDDDADADEIVVSSHSSEMDETFSKPSATTYLVPDLYRTGPADVSAPAAQSESGSGAGGGTSTTTTTAAPDPIPTDPAGLDPVPVAVTTETAGAGAIGVPYGNDVLVPTPEPATDLILSTSEAIMPRLGTPGLFFFTIRNAGTNASVDTQMTLDLSTLPTGSTYAIESLSAAGTSGRLTPVPGQPGVYNVDFFKLASGAIDTVAVMVNPVAVGPIKLTATAVDAAYSLPDTNPSDNAAVVGVYVTPAVQVMSVGMATSSTIQLDLDSAVAPAVAQDLHHYHLSTAGTAPRTVRIRSATYNAAHDRLTLRLARAVPVAATRLNLTLSGLGTTADPTASTMLALTSPRRAR